MISNKEKILQTAIKQIGLKGFDAVSIRNITKEVGIKESSFYNHFQSKDSLLDTIFDIMEKNLNQLRPDKDELYKLCQRMSLEEFLHFRLDQFLEGWSNPEARYLWYVVSHQQYKNKKAAELIVQESEKSIEMYAGAFKYFMDSRKMKKGDPYYLANLFGYSFRAIHLDCTYRSYSKGEKRDDFTSM